MWLQGYSYITIIGDTLVGWLVIIENQFTIDTLQSLINHI